jgi:hypothetical protein
MLCVDPNGPKTTAIALGLLTQYVKTCLDGGKSDDDNGGDGGGDGDCAFVVAIVKDG